MIYIIYGVIDRQTAPRQYIHNIDGYFDGYHEDFWTSDAWAQKVLQEIDKSKFIAPKIVDSPILGQISHEWISGGSKQLIMMNHEHKVVYDGDNLGDNCWGLFLELGKIVDIMINLSYSPIFKWIPDGELTIIDTGEVITSFEQFLTSRINGDRHKKHQFKDINWPCEIDYTRFELDNIDF